MQEDYLYPSEFDNARNALFFISNLAAKKTTRYFCMDDEDVPHMMIDFDLKEEKEINLAQIEAEILYDHWYFAVSTVILHDAKLRVCTSDGPVAILKRNPDRDWDDAKVWRALNPNLQKAQRKMRSALEALDQCVE